MTRKITVLGIMVAAVGFVFGSCLNAQNSAMRNRGFNKVMPSQQGHAPHRRPPSQGPSPQYGHGRHHPHHQGKYHNYGVAPNINLGFGTFGGNFGWSTPYVWGGHYGANYVPDYGFGYNRLNVHPYYSGPAYIFDGSYGQQLEYLSTTVGSPMPGTTVMRPTLPNTGSSIVVPTNATAMSNQLLAEQAFREGRYQEASDLANQAIGQDPSNGKLFLFASQTKFAMGQFDLAVADLDQAIRLIPREQWGWVVDNFRRLYRSDAYVRQMDQLTTHLAQRPGDTNALTLRGYHYAALKYVDAARADFDQALRLDPANQLATTLRTMVEPSIPEEAIPAPIPPAPVQRPPTGENGTSAPPLRMIQPAADQSNTRENRGLQLNSPNGP